MSDAFVRHLETPMLKTPRRLLLSLAAVLTIPIGHVAAQGNYPDHTVRIVVNSGAGVSTDIIARAVAQQLQEKWGQPVVVENRPGASGTIGAAEVVRSKADGHTMLIGVTNLLQTEFLMPKLSYKFSSDLANTAMAPMATAPRRTSGARP